MTCRQSRKFDVTCRYSRPIALAVDWLNARHLLYFRVVAICNAARHEMFGSAPRA